MKSFTHSFSLTLLRLMSLLALSLCNYQSAQAAPVACTYIVEGGTSKLIVDGKQAEFAITVRASQPSCTWTAKSNNPTWVHVTNGGNYTGSAQVTVTVDHNNTQIERIGTINMVGEIYTIKQEDDCFYYLSDLIQTVGKAGGDITVKAASNCPATVIPEVSWIKFNGPANHPPFTKAITFTVAPNNGPARTGRVKIAKYYLTVHQEGTCQYTLLSTSQSVPGAGGNYFVEVTRHRTCQVTAISDSAWVKITNTTGGSEEKAKINYAVSPNSGAARTAKLTIAGQPVTISQSAAQSAPILFALNPGFVLAGTPSLTVTLLGNNFTANSQAHWNGSNRPTTLINASQLKVALSEVELKTAATNKVMVFDSGTGQGSIELPFFVLSPQASVSAASYKGEAIAPDSIVAAFGVKLADSVAVAKTVPLPTNLAGTTVRVIDSANLERLAPLFFVSASQVNYLMPADTALGQATVVITSQSGDLSVGYVNIAKVAPGVFTATANGAGHPSALALRIKANGAQVYESVVRYDQASQKFVAVPIDLTVAGEQVFLMLYGTGMRNRSGLNTVNPQIGGTSVAATYVGPSGLAGLDQLNALLPASLIGRGEVDLVLTVDGKIANTVKLTFK